MAFPNIQDNPAAAIPVWIVGGSTPSPPPGSVPLAYVQYMDLSTAQSLATLAPAGSVYATVKATGGNVNYRGDSGVPTGTIGMPFYVTETLNVSAPFTDWRFIQQAGQTAVLHVTYWGTAS